MEQIREREWTRYIHYGTIREGEAAQWLTFEIPLPGVSREQADARAEELEAVEGISSVEVKTLGQE